MECYYVVQNCSEAGGSVRCLYERSIFVSHSLRLSQELCTCHDTDRFCDLHFSVLTEVFILACPSVSFFLPLCLVLMDKRKSIFPGNLLYLQSGDMADRPLLINFPLNFNRLIINYWGINVQIQLCCPSSVHKCQQRYFMAYAVEHSDSQSPLP